jgi:hypothetical protein
LSDRPEIHRSKVEGDPPWVAEAPHAREIIPAIMPGAEHMIEFHGVVEGACWGGIAGEPGVLLNAGDLILFPQGHPHVMSSDPGLRAPVQSNDLFFSPRPPQLPYALSMHGAEIIYEHLDGRTAGPGCATLACGFLGLDARPFNPLLAALPRVLVIPGSTLGADSWVMTFLRAVVKEANERRPGGEAVLERMTEMLFVEVRAGTSTRSRRNRRDGSRGRGTPPWGAPSPSSTRSPARPAK